MQGKDCTSKPHYTDDRLPASNYFLNHMTVILVCYFEVDIVGEYGACQGFKIWTNVRNPAFAR